MSVLLIVLVTLALRTALLPLSLRAYKAQRTTDPAALRQSLSGDPAALQAAGARALSGLLPSLAQLPFIWIVYRWCSGQAATGSFLADRLWADPALPGGWLVVALLAAVAAWTVYRLPAGAPKLARVLPFGTAVFALFVPLATGIYLATSGLWTAAERFFFSRRP